jgi:hypothetical protein
MTHPLPISTLHASTEFEAVLARERAKSLLLRAWIVAGLFFMAVPGTLLGFSNLIAISTHHGLGTLSPAWIEGHGHAQMFGWIGSFILGIGFYSQPARGRQRLPLACFLLWISGVALRWTANIYGWHWRTLLPASATLELIAIAIFLVTSSHHKMPQPKSQSAERRRVELWMTTVLIGTAGFTIAVVLNFIECLRLALFSTAPSFPHALDQRYLVLLGWGFLVPFVWGFSARWFHTFLSLPTPNARLLRTALALLLCGLVSGLSGFSLPATVLFAISALVIAPALHLIERPHGPAKINGIHRSFPVFARLAYAWLIIAGALSVWAATSDIHGGIWGAARHALTVGFAATMVFSIGPRILPEFAGVRGLFSKRLMLASLLLLQLGCTLRVCSEPLAYEGILSFAWHTLPVSGMIELAAVLIFAFNLGVTVLMGKSAFAAPSNLLEAHRH